MSRRDELLDAGMRLFAERGYTATTVADIQSTCGLTAGSGALYKHFASKEALLEAGVQRYVGELQERRTGFVAALPENLREALHLTWQAVTGAMTGDRSIIRVTMRDLESFPDLLDLVWEGLMESLYQQLAAWITAQAGAGRVAVANPAATASVLVASLTYPLVLEALVARRPGAVDPDDYQAAWVDSAVASLHPTTAAAR